MAVGWLVHCDALILLIYVTFTFTFRTFSRLFCPKRLTVVHAFIHGAHQGAV